VGVIGLAQDIIRDAQVALQDDGTRWPAPELVRYLRDGVLALLRVKPEESESSVAFVPVPGAKQALPVDAMRLLSIDCNAQGRWRAMTMVERADLQAVARDWLSMTPAVELVHWMAPATEPRTFYVYPPARDGAALELTYCKYPDPIPEPGSAAWASVTGATGVEARWNAALRDYVLYRAWLKDAESGANAQLAAGYLSTFTAQLGAAQS